jgi:hypothetical protein
MANLKSGISCYRFIRRWRLQLTSELSRVVYSLSSFMRMLLSSQPVPAVRVAFGT